MNSDPLTTRQKALLLGSPGVVGLLGALAWAVLDQIRGRKAFTSR